AKLISRRPGNRSAGPEPRVAERCCRTVRIRACESKLSSYITGGAIEQRYRGADHERPTSPPFAPAGPPAGHPGHAPGGLARYRPPGPRRLGLRPGAGPPPPLRLDPLARGRPGPGRLRPAPVRRAVAVRHLGGRRLRPRAGLAVRQPQRLPLAVRRRLRQLP